jgi:hypothetical protein
MLPALLHGKEFEVIGDRGYCSEVDREELEAQRIRLLTPTKKPVGDELTEVERISNSRLSSRVVKRGSVVSILRVLTKRGGDDEKNRTRLRLKLRPGLACQGLALVATKVGAYPLRYVEDFFGGSNEGASSAVDLAQEEVKLSRCARGNHFSPPC